MSFWNTIFDSFTKNEKKRNADPNNLAETYEPCREIGIKIIVASNVCFQHLKSNMNITDEKEKFAEIMIFCEFIYFYIHLTMRQASLVMTIEQMRKLQEYLVTFFVGTVVDAFFTNYPQESKEKITDVFNFCLTNADIEYTSAKSIISKNGQFSENTLCNKLGLRVAKWFNNSLNPAFILQAAMKAAAELRKMKLNNLVTRASNNL